ncbi:ABC transporter substrate-binding protein [Leptospira fluminis]|uniref:ABC transporter substrate-binding protein n=1 Tax=Leptospira fluminis TaxID=2484979 RepID=A0A4R9GLT1_9LEPT|nr:transporter substrate-binding domain-containing protein [Leptospira fluminis]TGK15122.1 ABC transporter substrate-binding protein [Leptospira fluminis]
MSFYLSKPFRLFVTFFLFLFSVSLAAQGDSTDSRLLDIQKRGELRVTGNRTFAPFYIDHPKDGFPGFDAELGKRYADFLGVKYVFIPKPEFEDFAEAVQKGEADLALSGVTTTLERSKVIQLSKPYLVSTPSALVRKSVLPPPPEGNIITTQYFRSIKDLGDLTGVSFAVRAFSGSHEYMLRAFPNSRIFTYGSLDGAWKAVREGTANCLVAEAYHIKGILLLQPSVASSYRPLLEAVQEDHIAALLPKSDLVYLRNFEFFISELKRKGDLKALEDKYFNSGDWVR